VTTGGLGALLFCVGGGLDVLGPDPRVLTLAGGAARRHTLDVEAGHYARVVVEQRGIDVVVTLRDPQGRSLAVVDSPNARRGTEPVSWIAETSGAHQVEVASRDTYAVAGAYEVRVESLRAAGPRDPDRVGLDRLLAEGARLLFERKAESSRTGLAACEDALRLARRVEDGPQLARALQVKGLLQRQLGDRRAALKTQQARLALHRSRGERPGEADSLNQLALLHWQLGESETSLPLFHQALERLRNQGERDGELSVLNNLALVLRSQGRLHEALAEARKALALMQDSGHPGLPTALNNVGSLLDVLGDPHGALGYFGQALEAFRRAGRERDTADTLSNVAFAHQQLGRPQDALRTFDQALRLARERGDRRAEAAILQNMGSLHRGLGSLDAAKEYLEAALSIHVEAGQRRAEAEVLHELARVHLRQGSEPRALERLRRASDIWDALADPRGRAINLSETAAVLLTRGRAAEALPPLEQALALHRTSGALQGEAIALGQVAHARWRLADRPAARQAFQQALDLWTRGGNRPRQADTRRSLALLEKEEGRLEDARAHVEAALDIVETMRSGLLRTDLRTSLQGLNRDAYELYIEVLMDLHAAAPQAGHDARALAAAERLRARSLLDLLAESRTELRRDTDPALQERLRAVQEQVGALADEELFRERPTGRGERRRRLDELLREHAELEARARERSPRYAALLSPPTLGLEEVRAQVLDGESLLLVYVLGERRSFLWALSATSLASFPLPPRGEIEAAVRTVRLRWTSPGGGEGTPEARRLSQIVLGPAARLPWPRRLVVVADGALQYVPFSALPWPGQDAPLLARHEVVSIPSVSSLALLRGAPRTPPSRLLAVFADPVFDRTDPRVPGTPAGPTTHAPEPGGPRFLRLGASRREAEGLLSLAGADLRYSALGFQATRSAALDPGLADYRYVHFATHSTVDPVRPELSGIVLSLVGPQGQDVDGVLRLYDIFDMRLGADLVVLSACETALGPDVRGEGLTGLVRGFMHAGAPRVVASLWRVPDAATAALMRRFYEGLLVRNRAPAAALREAQMALRATARWRHPHHWAGFVLHGEWRP
jgi:CHAT domain-containing protein/tetratricopeptide (TPR) repeat protein